MSINDRIPLQWHDGLLWISAANLDCIEGGIIGHVLRERFQALPKVGHLRSPYVRTDKQGSLVFSLQAVCAIAANSVRSVAARGDSVEGTPSCDAVFETCKALIIENEAYKPFKMPPKPWRPLPALKRRKADA